MSESDLGLDGGDDTRTPAPMSSIAQSDGFGIVELWKQYERVAMHFNDLLIRLRSQALAAVAAFATIAGVVLKSVSIPPGVRWETLAGISFALALFWLAIWILDFAYYNRLLLGAVKALLDIEEASATSTIARQISLSTHIENAVGKRGPFSKSATSAGESVPNRPLGLWWFYSIVFAVLILATGWAIWMKLGT